MQRAAVKALADLGFGPARLLERELGRHGGVALEAGVERLDAGQDGGRDLDRGHIARGDVLGDGRQRLVVDVVEGHGWCAPLGRGQMSGGRRVCQSVACWKACAARRRPGSDRCGPISWKPIGMPTAANPQGRVMLGLPLTLNGEV